MKKFILKIYRILNCELPWWVALIIGLPLMVLPSCYAATKGITTLEPGFTYGVLYGVGLIYSLCGIFSFFDKKKKAADQEKTGH